MLALGLLVAAPAGLLPTGGVLVRLVELLLGPVDPSCFVGLFAGDLSPPGVPNLDPGVGLADKTLALLLFASATLCLFSPLTPVCTLLGRLLTPFPNPLLFGASRTCLMPAGRQNMP